MACRACASPLSAKEAPKSAWLAHVAPCGQRPRERTDSVGDPYPYPLPRILQDVMQVTGALSTGLGSVALAQSASLARLHVTTDTPMCQRTTGHRSPIPCGRRGWVPEHLPLCPSGRSTIGSADGRPKSTSMAMSEYPPVAEPWQSTTPSASRPTTHWTTAEGTARGRCATAARGPARGPTSRHTQRRSPSPGRASLFVHRG